MQTTYRPGQWYLIVLPGALVALPPDASADVVSRLWERMPQQKTLATVIDVLTSHAGGDFGSLPSFVAAVAEGPDIRIALRGAVTASVRAGAGQHEFSGAGVTTWNERFVSDASRVEITLEAAGEGAALPVHSGVVRAAAVSAELAPADEATTIAPEESVPAPERVAPVATPLVAAEPEPAEPEPAEPEPVEPEPISRVEEATMTPTEVTLAPSTEDFDQLWGATVHSVPAELPAADAPATETRDQGDHDGATISSAQLRAVRPQTPLSGEAATAVIPMTPGATGRVRVSTGQVVSLDRTVIIGRRPRSTRASGANLPHLIAVDSPQQDISRSHLEIRPEGDTVVVIDLHTTNGSTLLRPGADPMRLHPGEQTLVLSGDVVDLGDGVTVAFEDLP